MSTSYIAIFPRNPLLPNPERQTVISELKKAGFIHDLNYEWTDPETKQVQEFYRPGPGYEMYCDLYTETGIDIRSKVPDALIEYKEHGNIEGEFCATGDFIVTNPETGSTLGDDWSSELGLFFENNDHKWTDPANNKEYYFFELECPDIGLGRHFITIEDGWGEPNENLMKLLEKITGQEYKWMWVKI
jgi:acetyltransferase-like isoleucine patch superfamily enzyme